jgi:hypothetical protein
MILSVIKKRNKVLAIEIKNFCRLRIKINILVISALKVYCTFYLNFVEFFLINIKQFTQKCDFIINL